MTVILSSISLQALADLQASATPFTLLDVRRSAARDPDGTQIQGAQWLDPAAWLDWKDGVSKGQRAVVYCAKGHEIGQAMTAALTALGVQASYLEGGIAQWKAAGLPVVSIT